VIIDYCYQIRSPQLTGLTMRRSQGLMPEADTGMKSVG
jgi:hypothetical protein